MGRDVNGNKFRRKSKREAVINRKEETEDENEKSW
jgi:hypothetical protein